MITQNGILQLIIYFVLIAALIKPIGWYLARVFSGQPCGLNRILAPVESLIYKLSGIDPKQEMSWKKYTVSLLSMNAIGFIVLFLLLKLQHFLPLNPQQFLAMPTDLAFNTASSFVTNTNWQNYGGESTLSYLTQMLGLAVQNFLSAATGIAVLVALIRGLVRHEVHAIGNFWVDCLRGILYVLLPLSILFACLLVTQGVIQSFKPYQQVELLQPFAYQTDQQEITVSKQTIPMGTVASQVAIKQLGTNGGGFFNTNSAHPFENPTPFSNFLEMVLILLLPTAFCYTAGLLMEDNRQGWILLITMTILFAPMVYVSLHMEQSGNPLIAQLGISEEPVLGYPGGNMEGKETRFGVLNSALWGSITTATSNGSVNSMLDSFTPLGGFVSMWFILLDEVVFGGVGSGIYSMIIFILIAAFIAGLMTGRTPEYLGKKIESFEIKMASLVILLMPFMVLLATGIAILIPQGKEAIFNPGVHGFSEVFYGFLSMANNNGSAFAGLKANTTFYNILGGLIMLVGRYGVIIPVLAIAGSLARKKRVPPTDNTLPTHTPLFAILLIGVVIIVGALTFFSALMIGPFIEYLQLHQ